MSVVSQRFRPRERLKHRADIARTFAEKRSASDGRLVVYVADNGLDWSRLGLSVGKRVGNAVARNRTRRRLREAFRRIKGELPTGLDLICVAQRPEVRDFDELLAALAALVRKAAARKARGAACPAAARNQRLPGRKRT